MANPTNVMANPYTLSVAGALAPFELNLSWGSWYTLKDIKSQRTGDDILEQMVLGRGLVIEATFIEYTLALAQQWLGLAAGTAALAVGALLPTQVIQLHPVAMGADETLDIYLYRGAFSNLRQAINGASEMQPQVTIMGLADGTGKVWQYGPPA